MKIFCVLGAISLAVASASGGDCPSTFGFPETFFSCKKYGRGDTCCDGRYEASLASMCKSPGAMPPGVCRAHAHQAFDAGLAPAPVAKSIQKNATDYNTRVLKFNLHAKESIGDSWTKSTYRSQALPLKPGEVVFTKPASTFVKMHDLAEGVNVAIKSMVAEVVDSDGNSVPLSEVYNHHWLFFDPNHPNAGVCGGFLPYKFGVGAECRNTPTSYPGDYAVTTQAPVWGANIHLLRTVNVKDVKNCIECGYAPGKGCSKSASGTFNCCQDGSYCETLSSDGESKNYYLQYHVQWRKAQQEDVPVEIFVLDASNCRIEYNIPTNPTGIHTTDLTWPVQHNSTFVFGVGHQHIGGINTTLMYQDPGESAWKTLCTSYPTYGKTKGKAGDEEGYVTAISTCGGLKQRVTKGAKIRVLSLYNVSPDDPRSFDTGAHGGVMSLFYVAATVDK